MSCFYELNDELVYPVQSQFVQFAEGKLIYVYSEKYDKKMAAEAKMVLKINNEKLASKETDVEKPIFYVSSI